MKSVVKVRNVAIGEGIPKICAPLVGKSLEELMEEASYLKELPLDLVEWRVDFYDDFLNIDKIKTVLQEIRKLLTDIPIIFTFRSLKEGGEKEVTREYYLKLNKEIIRTKLIDIVDIELFNDEKHIEEIISTAEENGVAVILSAHDFEKTPSKDEILDRYQRAVSLGAHIFKVAVMPNSTEDVINLLDASRIMKEGYGNIPIITMAMGNMGLISRISGEIFGSDITFGSGKEMSAPGQVPVEELRKIIDTIHQYNY
ncbi:type I 3-dehydroquinate dehydratase [Clostridium tunisiense]|uniref:type I 3-dehydroquinate dehydratase n=1 Tax=Clostridium tunisiense TaxID=219748 RepID=UPI000305CC30|nr:type I 3-dehydroquinate dehydratase [Clostridium tunisiense]